MSSKNTTKVLIAGKIITISGYESEEYLQKVANYLNNKISELAELPGYHRQPVDTKNTLLCLNLADDYFKVKKQAELFEENMQIKDRELYDLKHELVTLQVQLDSLKNELKHSQLEKNILEEKNSKLENELDDLLK